jgi:hypothetical protein
MELTGQLALTVLMGAFLLAVLAWLSRVSQVGIPVPALGGSGYGGGESYVNEEKPAGVIRWLTTVDHKDIGMLYGLYAIIAFAVGG